MEDTGDEYFFVEIVLLNGATKRPRFGLKPTVTVEYVEKKMRSTYNVTGGTISSNSRDTYFVDDLVADKVYFFLEFTPLPVVQGKFIPSQRFFCFLSASFPITHICPFG
jgi:hypothetical protein